MFPIDWPEPSGMVMVEAMACGTPVIALRAGSVPEVIDHGVTGFICDNVDQAVAAVARVHELSRATCRRVFEQRVSAARMTEGRLATGAIALCEVQGYVYAARRAGAVLARALEHRERAAALDDQAEQLREHFERAFWCEELGTYALALDGDKQPCAVRASNAGHCLFAGIASAGRARRVVEVLLDDHELSGWGIRTLDTAEARYNPISYHNGSVWPHDNAIIAMGMACYGHKKGCARLLHAMYEASLHFDLRRMPELFCGFRPRPHEGPTLYPVACAPQAWAAGSVFLLLQACLGLQIDTMRAQIVLDRPILPASLERVTIRRLQVGPAQVDLVLENHAHDVGVHLAGRDGDVSVVITK